MAERLALPTLDHRVVGSNPAGGEILPEPKRRFIAQSLSYSPFHRLEMTEILLKGRKILTHPSILNVRNYLGVIGKLLIKKQTNKKYLKKDKRRKLNRKEFCNKHDKARPLVIYRLRSIDPVQFNISMVIFLALISAKLSVLKLKT